MVEHIGFFFISSLPGFLSLPTLLFFFNLQTFLHVNLKTMCWILGKDRKSLVVIFINICLKYPRCGLWFCCLVYILLTLFKVSRVTNYKINWSLRFSCLWKTICFKYISLWSLYWTVKLYSSGINGLSLSTSIHDIKINAVSFIITQIIF